MYEYNIITNPHHHTYEPVIEVCPGRPYTPDKKLSKTKRVKNNRKSNKAAGKARRKTK
jgi:hypothetical protein